MPKVVPGIPLQTIQQIDEDRIYGKNLAKRVLEKSNANPIIIRKQTIKQEREGNGETIEFHPYKRTELQELRKITGRLTEETFGKRNSGN